MVVAATVLGHVEEAELRDGSYRRSNPTGQRTWSVVTHVDVLIHLTGVVS